MTGMAHVPRSRGAVSGVLLILLGAWGGLAPFIGRYTHIAYLPDNGWQLTSGRLYLSVVPGAVALLGGLLAVAASHRGVGGFGAFIAALGGAWFIVGTGVTSVVMKSESISPGHPEGGALGSLSAADRVLAEQMAFFTGTGVLILFFAALALGRFSVVGVRDAELAAEEEEPIGGEMLEHDMGYGPATGQYPVTETSYLGQSSDPGPLRGPG
jgi:hypothetical protein